MKKNDGNKLSAVISTLAILLTMADFTKPAVAAEYDTATVTSFVFSGFSDVLTWIRSLINRFETFFWSFFRR